VPYLTFHFQTILLYIYYFFAQNPATKISVGDDQTNWAEMWKVMPKSSDGRSALADSTRSSLFDIILKANAEARRKFFMASLFTV
jgi:hypothetical protein